MIKTKGPYLEFKYYKNGPKIEYIFLPGNAKLELFKDIEDNIYKIFINSYGNNAKEYIRYEYETMPKNSIGCNKEEFEIKTIAINQKKILNVLEIIKTLPCFKSFNVVFNTKDKNNKDVSLVLTSFEDIKEAKKYISCYNQGHSIR